MGGFQPFETMPDMSKFLFAGLEQAQKDREKRDKSKAMKDLFSSVSTLFKDEIPNWNPSSTAAPPAWDLTPPQEPAPAGIPSGAPSPVPAPVAAPAGAPMPVAAASPSAGPAQGGPPPVVGMPPLSPEQIAKAKEAFAGMSPEDQAKAMEAGKQAMGVPAGPAPAAGPSPGMLNLQPPPPAGPMSPVGPGMPPGAPGQNPNALRGGILQSLAQTSGDYAPEAVAAIHSLFSVSPFKDAEGRDVYSATPGSVVMDKKGRTLFKVPEKADEAGIKKAEIGAKSRVDVAEIGAGSREAVADTNAASREAVAEIRGKWQYKTAAARTAAAKEVAKLRISAGDRINSPAKLYTYLAQKHVDDSLTGPEKDLLNHLEPVIIKMGGLQALLDMRSGVPSNPPPWGGKEPAAPEPEVQKEVGWWGSLFGGAPAGGTPAPGAAPVPAPIKKGAKAPGKAAPAAATGGPGFSIGGQKLTAPAGHADADIQMTMDSMQAKLKEGYSKDQLVEHLRKKGWKVGQ